MGKKFKQLIRLNSDDLILYFSVVGGVFLLIHLITACVLFFGDVGSSPMVSGVVLPIVAGFMAVIATISHVGVAFTDALRFGQTRKTALALTLGLSAFETISMAVLSLLLTILERCFAPHLWTALSGAGGYVMDSPVPVPEGSTAVETGLLYVEDVSLSWWWALLIPLGCLLLGLIIGAFLQRFGGKAGWILWGVWMVVCFGPQLLPWDRLPSLPLFPVVYVLAPLVALALLIWSLWSLLHAVVKA